MYKAGREILPMIMFEGTWNPMYPTKRIETTEL